MYILHRKNFITIINNNNDLKLYIFMFSLGNKMQMVTCISCEVVLQKLHFISQ